MTSGDQTLSEFLSLTGKLPYYDMQSWKKPLASALQKTAFDIGGEALRNEVIKRFTGVAPFTGNAILPNPTSIGSEASPETEQAMRLLEKQIRARTADGAVRALIARATQSPCPSNSAEQKAAAEGG